MISNLEVQMGIKQVKELAFMMDESAFRIDMHFKMNIQTELSFDFASDDLFFQIAVTFLNDEHRNIARIEVMNNFVIQNLRQFHVSNSSEKIEIPEDLLTIIFSISFSHARALMSNHLNGTAIQSLMIPVISPKAVLKTLKIQGIDLTKSKKKVSSPQKRGRKKKTKV